ncbi:MAG TPA: hypothetical protein EYP19_13665 [Desulfobacterales bacterium]|nr:hypothetical protein [Desulfobacterales bacterium]
MLFQRFSKRPLEAYPDEDHERGQPVEWLGGPCILFRREALEEVGLLDERFFIFYEETDICYRLHRAGWQRFYCPEAVIVHVGKQTVSKPTGTSWCMTAQMSLSRYLYYQKHAGWATNICLRAVVLANLLAKLAKCLLLLALTRDRGGELCSRRELLLYEMEMAFWPAVRLWERCRWPGGLPPE